MEANTTNSPKKSSSGLLTYAIVVLSAVIVFSQIYNYGFEWGDLGFHAQIATEVYRGAAPTDFPGYGPLWYDVTALAVSRH
jgi:hypothetical protein